MANNNNSNAAIIELLDSDNEEEAPRRHQQSPIPAFRVLGDGCVELLDDEANEQDPGAGAGNGAEHPRRRRPATAQCA